MKKEKLYNPDECGSFKMMFGFNMAVNYMPNNRKTKKKKNESNPNYREPSKKSV